MVALNGGIEGAVLPAAPIVQQDKTQASPPRATSIAQRYSTKVGSQCATIGNTGVWPMVKGVVAGYVRVSSRRQRDESDSPASQRQRLKDAGCTLFFEDLAVSGYQLAQRRKAVQFQQLWEAIATRAIHRLVATRLDRYARRDQIVLDLADHCEQHGVEFLSLSSGLVDTSSATGWLNVKMQLVFAEHYSRQLSENVRHGFAGLHSQGIPACSGRSIPWHLQRDPNNRHGVIKGPGWDDARYVFEQILADKWTLTDAAAYIYPRHGVIRSHTSVRLWLEKPSLVGHMVWHPKRADRKLMRDVWPALATELEQHQVLALIKSRNRVLRSRGASRQVRPLSGLCVCGQCRSNMKISGGSGKRQYLRCSSIRAICKGPMVPVLPIERQLHQLLRARIERLLNKRSIKAPVTPSPEAKTWIRELQAREAIPAEFRQEADQRRITELQGLLANFSQQPNPNREALLELQGRVLDARSWFDRPDEDRNTDLRQLIREVVVNCETRSLQRVTWMDGTEQAVDTTHVKACKPEPFGS